MATFTAVKRLNGTSQIASNTVKAAGGASYVVSNDVLQADTTPRTIFTPTVEVNPVLIVNFRLSDSLNRVFRL